MDESSFLNPAAAIKALRLLPGQRVVDFSAGAGFFARAAARAVGEGGMVWAIDSNPELLSRVKNVALAEGLHNVEIVQGNPEQANGTHLPTAGLDACLVVNMLFASTHKAGVAAEAARVLRRGGKLLVIDWTDSFGGLGPAPDSVVSEAQARAVFEPLGFSYSEDIRAGAYHWGCILSKTG
jgi:ubiquinone/menaquinone biosynthesis C-methylase UbiE